MNIDAALGIFLAESQDLLEQMEEALLRIEESPADEELINAIFRAAHTIKGSAGLFGFDSVVAFTHVAESVLDMVRDGEVAITSDLVALLLEARDHIKVLIDHASSGTQEDPATRTTGADLQQRLTAYLTAPAAGNDSASEKIAPQKLVISEPEPDVERHGGGPVETDCWHLSLRFGPDVFRSGMDPLSFLRYLGTLGDIVGIVAITDGLPVTSDFDPETSYLGYEISLKSGADKLTLEKAFEFVEDDSDVRILPPHSRIDEYLRLIDALSDETLKLGEILVRCGTLTPRELESALRMQAGSTEAEPQPIGQVLVDAGLVQAPVVDAALDKQQQSKEHRASEANLIRVDADKLDQLINQVGELIIACAGSSLIAQSSGIPELQEATATVSRMVEEVRDSALSLRMVQIGATFSRFKRVVRDVGKDLHKSIRLEISGEETELDKTVVERIGDPLTHLVRNAIDHGIESPQARLAAGKSETGTLRLNAYHDSGCIVIEVSDDGAGLNRERILAKAIERELVPPGAVLTDSEVWNLIFEPGFSTASQVSNLSGRGVGMDVVRRNIQALRGTVEIDSTQDVGTTMRIRLPLTLAIIDGFLVGVGTASYVIPLDAVVECIDAPPRKEIHVENDSSYLNLRGEVLPFLRLSDVFEIGGDSQRRQNVVVVRFGNQKAGLVVDRLLGECQTVIKPLGKLFGRTRGLGGFTILGSGEVALILDVSNLIQQVTQREAAVSARPQPGIAATAAPSPAGLGSRDNGI